MQLVACPNCHTQYDVSDVSAEKIPCRCGDVIDATPPEAVDAGIHRCGSCGALVTQDAGECEYCGSSIVRDQGQLSLICPECYARSGDDSRFCTACGVAFRPERVQIEGYELPCPACGVLMPPRQIAGIGLNECTRCNGLWVPDESFDLLVSRAIQARRSTDPARLQAPAPRVKGSNPATQTLQYRNCPVCDAYMLRRNFRRSSGVIIDVCHSHGTWLDPDELEQIAGFILSGGQTARILDSDSPATKAERSAATAFARLRAENGKVTPDANDSAVGSLLGILTRLLT